MTPGRLGSVRPKDFIGKLSRTGYRVDHQSGSHAILINDAGIRLTVPVHARDMKRGLLVSPFKQASLSSATFSSSWTYSLMLSRIRPVGP